MAATQKRKKCAYCGQEFTAAGCAKHETKCPKKPPLSSGDVSPNFSNQISALQKEWNQRFEELQNRISALESNLTPENTLSLKITPNITPKTQSFKEILFQLLAQLTDQQQIKGNFPLKVLKEQFMQEYSYSEKEFEDNILRLYRKQEIDLQPGGDVHDYHIASPTKKLFYYLVYTHGKK
jgi:hypothetical protein